MRMIQRAARKPDAFMLAWPYKDAQQLIPKLKEFFPVRSYEREPLHHWRIPADVNAGRLMEFALEFDFSISEEACALFDSIQFPEASEQSAVEKPKYPDRQIRGDVDKKGKDAIGIYFNYHPEILVAVRELEGAQFHDGQPKHWTCSRAAGAAVQEVAEKFSFTIAADLAVKLRQEKEKQGETERKTMARKLSLLAAAEEIERGGVYGGKTPRDYQKADVLLMLDAIGRYAPNSGVILASQVGLGKTFEALLVARCFHRALSCQVIVVCPVSLKGDWAAEAKACEVPCSISSWASIPEPPNRPYILIADEAHFLQGGSTTIRGQAITKLALNSNCLTFIAASATPMRGMRPKNLFPILKAIQHPLAKNKDAYELRYCDKKLKQFGKGKSFYDSNGAKHLDELMREIAPVFIQRFKKDVLKQLPPETIIPRTVEISPKAKAIYETAFREAQATYNARRQATEAKIERELKAGKRLDQIEFTKDDARDGADAVVLLGHLRRAASLARIESTIEFADDFLDQGEKILIYSEYPEVCNQIAAHYRKIGIGAESLTGSVKEEEREASKARFQRGNSRVFCLTKAGGVGLTLTAASNGILVDQPWMWDDVKQIVGRLHRLDAVMQARIDAKENPAVTAYLLKSFEIDDKIQARLFEQRRAAEGVEKGQRSTMRGVKSINDLAREVARELFGK